MYVWHFVKVDWYHLHAFAAASAYPCAALAMSGCAFNIISTAPFDENRRFDTVYPMLLCL